MAEPERPVAAGWNVVPASVIGSTHVRLGVVNQDRYLTHALSGGARLFAVADGAGSRSRSEFGAQYAVEAARLAAERHYSPAARERTVPGRLRTAHAFARGCLEAFDGLLDGMVPAMSALAPRPRATDRPDTRDDRDDPRKEYGTTLLAVVAEPPWYAFFGVGDCFLVVDRVPGGARLVVPPPAEREHDGATVLLTSRDRWEHAALGVLHDPLVRGLAVCTDGVMDALLSSRRAADGSCALAAPEEMSRYFDHFAAPGHRPEDLAERLASEDFARTSGDDKTMILAVLRP